METFIIAAISVGIFFSAYSWLLFCKHKDNDGSPFLQKLKHPILPFLILGFVGCLCAYFIVPNQIDALAPTSLAPVVGIFTSGILLLIGSHYISSAKILNIAFFILCLVNIFLLPQNISLTDGHLSPLAEKLILAFSWGAFVVFYPILNGINGIVTIQSLSVCTGLMLLFAIGIFPMLDGYYSCIYIALFLSYNFFSRYPASLKITDFDSKIMGFLVGWMGVLAAIEGDSSCFIILNMYYFYEFICAVCKKLMFHNQFKKLSGNTFYNKLASAGISPQNICQLTIKINLIMLILAGFQIYSPNYYTIIIISFFMVFWITSRITAPEENNQHLLLTGSILSLFRKNKAKPSAKNE